MASTARSAAVAAALLGVLVVLRPGFVSQAAGSPRAWLTLAGVLLLVLGTRHVVRRTVGPRAATAAGLVVALGATALLVGPSFRQRTLNEPLPAALEQPAVAVPATVQASPLPVTTRAPTSAAPRRPTASPRAVPVVPVVPVVPAPAQPAQPPPVRRSAPPQGPLAGELQGIDHRASGRIVLYAGSGEGLVRFEDVDIEGSVGPSVHLVPAGKRRPDGGIRLGPLKAERGSFSYVVPASVDLRDGWTVLVWCDPYEVPIAAADPA
jgi:hypothetical protein